MIALAVYAGGLVVLVIACYGIAWVLVRVLDPVIGYRPEREDGRTPWPDDHRPRPPVAVGPGRVSLHAVAHGRKVLR